MRMMQYELKLFERGYVVTNGPMHDFERAYEDECLPIKLTVLECCKNWEVATIADVILNDDRWGTDHRPLSKYFQNPDGYQKILLGESSKWYLYSFEVNNRYLTLDFYNPKEGCSDYIILFTEVSFRLKLQFDLLRRDGGPGARYLVLIDSPEHPTEEIRKSQSTARVTEYYQSIRRELELEWRGDDEYVYVTEYADL